MNRNEYLTFDCAGGQLPARSTKTINAVPFLKAVAIITTVLVVASII